MASIYDELGGIAADPSTDWDTLHWVAENYPELRPIVAENPATYPELLDALGAIGDPEIDAALARRRGHPPAPAKPAGPVSSAGAASAAGRGSSSWWVATPDEPAPSPPVEDPAQDEGPIDPPEEEWFGSGSAGSASFDTAAPGPAGPASATASERSRRSPRRLLLALLLPILALVAVGAVVLGLLNGNSGDSTAAESGPETAASASPGAQDDDAEGGGAADDAAEDSASSPAPDSATSDPATPEELRAEVAALPAESSCDSVEDDAATLAEFGSAVTTEGAGLDSADSALVQETLIGLQESCGSVHAAALYLDLSESEDAASALATPVQEMGTAWIQTSFPAQGQQLSSFMSPDGNVICELGETLRCRVLQHSFDAPEGCVDGASYVIRVDAAAEPDCGNPVAQEGQPVLGYGQTASNEFFACSSFQSQMSCWNQLTGEGINLSASRNATY